jgi:hypothetical protein
MIVDYQHDTLDEVVIKLHDLARIIESEIGVGQLSNDVRKSADRLSEIVNATL